VEKEAERGAREGERKDLKKLGWPLAVGVEGVEGVEGGRSRIPNVEIARTHRILRVMLPL
jgi:hypothetical protein